ncbi:cytochrome b [Rhizobium sullae]|uniref:Cytochrome b n=2 Tax=Rhizobium sullae TaxID=50338 RepID=A0A2N0DCL0_RHISU|nr:cytochrome b [Rhizobium sullae]PKA43835.1 cytochrome b [Rhizobium sullae]
MEHICDDRNGYGLVTRVFHWTMAALFAWQFVGATLHALADDTAVADFFWGFHRDVGFVLFVTVIARGAWGLINMRRRPPQQGVLRTFARLGHLGLYALMILVPSVALIRQFGSGRPFAPFGIALIEGGGERVEWMTALGSLVHANAGWALLALVFGHAAMVVIHQVIWKDDTLARMAGNVDRRNSELQAAE